MMRTSSSSPVGWSATAENRQKPPAKFRKRKGRERKDGESINEVVGLDSADGKKQVYGSIYGKRSRVAEVHNLSERKRRDKINEKMRALQELIPRCYKVQNGSKQLAGLI